MLEESAGPAWILYHLKEIFNNSLQFIIKATYLLILLPYKTKNTM